MQCRLRKDDLAAEGDEVKCEEGRVEPYVGSSGIGICRLPNPGPWVRTRNCTKPSEHNKLNAASTLSGLHCRYTYSTMGLANCFDAALDLTRHYLGHHRQIGKIN